MKTLAEIEESFMQQCTVTSMKQPDSNHSLYRDSMTAKPHGSSFHNDSVTAKQHENSYYHDSNTANRHGSSLQNDSMARPSNESILRDSMAKPHGNSLCQDSTTSKPHGSSLHDDSMMPNPRESSFNNDSVAKPNENGLRDSMTSKPHRSSFHHDSIMPNPHESSLYYDSMTAKPHVSKLYDDSNIAKPHRSSFHQDSVMESSHESSLYNDSMTAKPHGNNLHHISDEKNHTKNSFSGSNTSHKPVEKCNFDLEVNFMRERKRDSSLKSKSDIKLKELKFNSTTTCHPADSNTKHPSKAMTSRFSNSYMSHRTEPPSDPKTASENFASAFLSNHSEQQPKETSKGSSFLDTCLSGSTKQQSKATAATFRSDGRLSNSAEHPKSYTQDIKDKLFPGLQSSERSRGKEAGDIKQNNVNEKKSFSVNDLFRQVFPSAFNTNGPDHFPSGNSSEVWSNHSSNQKPSVSAHGANTRSNRLNNNIVDKNKSAENWGDDFLSQKVPSYSVNNNNRPTGNYGRYNGLQEDKVGTNQNTSQITESWDDHFTQQETLPASSVKSREETTGMTWDGNREKSEVCDPRSLYLPPDPVTDDDDDGGELSQFSILNVACRIQLFCAVNDFLQIDFNI